MLVPVCLCVSVLQLHVSVCSVPNRGLCSVFIKQHRKSEGHFVEVINRVCHGTKSLNQTDPDNKQYLKHHCLSTNIQVEYLTCVVDIQFRRLLSASVFAFSKIHLHYLGQRHGRVHDLRLELCISCGCES